MPVRPVRSIRLSAPALVMLMLMLALAWPALGDVIRLKDGSTYEGDIRRSDDGWVITLAGGKRIVVPADKVAGLEAKPKSGVDVADTRLASLRRAVEAMPDIKQVIERYQSFVVQFAGTPAANAAKADLVIWQDRLDRGLVKAGGLWMTPAEREAVLEQSFRTAEQALGHLRQGQTTQALPLLDRALVENASNSAAWYMKGILLFKQDKAVEARKAFETASALLPDHAATYNNLAVVLWRQSQYVAALLNYEKALLAAPLHRGVLDNLAEALAALPEELRDGAHVRRIVRHFNDQDLLLQQQLASQDLYRWGATWVTKSEMDKLQAAEREIRSKIDQMEIEYNAVTSRLASVTAEIERTQNTIRQMEASSIGYDSSGRLVRYPLPPSYHAFVRDLAALQAERDHRQAEQEQMRQQARKLQQTLPTPKHTGVQRLIEWEGTPIFGAKQPVDANPPAVNARPPAGIDAAPPPATQPVVASPPPAAPAAPGAPPAAQPPASTRPASPSRPAVPHERPSILDRRFADPPPPPASQQPLQDDPQ